MRAVVLVAAAALSLAGVAACSTAPVPAPSPVTVTAPAPAPAPASPSAEPVEADPMAGLSNADKKDVFLQTLEAEGITVTDESGVVNAARQLCDELDAGTTTQESFVDELTGDGSFSPHDAGYIYGAATQVYCPENLN